MVRLTDRPDMTLDVYRGRKTSVQQYNNSTQKGKNSPLKQIQSTLVISTSVISNNRFNISKRKSDPCFNVEI